MEPPEFSFGRIAGVGPNHSLLFSGAFNNGNSGGPVLDSQWLVVGVVSAKSSPLMIIEKEMREVAGINFVLQLDRRQPPQDGFKKLADALLKAAQFEQVNVGFLSRADWIQKLRRKSKRNDL